MTNLQVNLVECLLGALRVPFSNDVDVKVAIDPLLDDFRSNSVVYLFSLSLSSCDEVSLKFIHYISDLFFFKHSLSRINLLGPILKTLELHCLALIVVILVSHFTNLHYLRESKKCNIWR